MVSVLWILAAVGQLVWSVQGNDDAASSAFLQQYGYLPSTTGNSLENIITPSAVRSALAEYQARSGLVVTGELDEATRNEMAKPRCGVADVGMGVMGVRSKRYVTEGSRWPRNDLTYRITNYGRRSRLTTGEMDTIIARAWQVWSDHTNLRFTKVSHLDSNADFEIFFKAGSHGDGDAFDGAGGVLAHAYFPRYGGDAHFDDAETFTEGSHQGVNLFQVAAHEFGHSLGLSHSRDPSALMAPTYQGYVANFRLANDDIRGIQSLYGRNTGGQPTTRPTSRPTPRPTPRPNPTPRPTAPPREHCTDSSIDAITTTGDGNTYAFQDEYYWTITYDQATRRIVTSSKRVIRSDWPGLEGNLDAAMTVGSATYFFKDTRLWVFVNKRNYWQRAYPIDVVFPNLPGHIDAAFQWSNDRLYFIKGSQYYRVSYDGVGVDSGYPRPLSVWSSRLNRVDSTFRWSNGRTYFFSGNSYYRYNDDTGEIDFGYPADTGRVWLGCNSNLVRSDLIVLDKDFNNGTQSDNNNVMLAKKALALEEQLGQPGSASLSGPSAYILTLVGSLVALMRML